MHQRVRLANKVCVNGGREPKQVTDDMAVIERAGFDAYRTFAAQLLLLARNFMRDQTIIAKPLTDWTDQGVIAAVRAGQRFSTRTGINRISVARRAMLVGNTATVRNPRLEIWQAQFLSMAAPWPSSSPHSSGSTTCTDISRSNRKKSETGASYRRVCLVGSNPLHHAPRTTAKPAANRSQSWFQAAMIVTRSPNSRTPSIVRVM
jgi:hypothetical protein